MLFYNKRLRTVEKRVRTASDKQRLGKRHFFFFLTVMGKPVSRYICLQFFFKRCHLLNFHFPSNPNEMSLQELGLNAATFQPQMCFILHVCWMSMKMFSFCLFFKSRFLPSISASFVFLVSFSFSFES